MQQNFEEYEGFSKLPVFTPTNIANHMVSWRTAIYTVDDSPYGLHTARNKGNEASVYLTYIIDNYDHLADVIVFIHGHQKHKHGTRDGKHRDRTLIFEGIDYDNLEAINKLDINFVKRVGYANLRCMAKPGCPDEIQPFRPEEDRDPLRPQEFAMQAAWAELFGNDDVPQIIASPCCAQFAVSGKTVMKRSKEEYMSYLGWIYATPLDDFTSGRIFEYLWHVIFGRDPV
jgi:hypothetical protein